MGAAARICRAVRWAGIIGAAALVLTAGTPSRAQESAADATLCRTAGAAAEAQFGLPTGLLAAIGRVESGRPDPATGAVAAWPWTINANGAGHMFASAVQATAGTRALQEVGVSSIDVGCFQINLLHHPAAFASLEEAFDPKANAGYAARFLSTLYHRLGGWESAIAAYHSSTPEIGLPYRDRVLAGWGGVPAPPVPVARPMRISVVAWAPAPAAGGVKVWTPSAFGTAAHVITIAPMHPPVR